MSLRFVIVAAIGLAACAGTRAAVTPVTAAAAPVAASAQGAKTQWDGVYTVEQAKRGEKLYAEKCSSCHGPDMNGGEMAPGLTGGEFTSNWNDLSLGDLFERMRISMPQNAPGSLSRQENADILSYILNKGNYPAGKAELPGQTEVLNGYKFLAVKP
jgi:S-disulfanyl-L-cysteine oxidoreductase SoxD